jgi:WS/DGAT C-terminal domain
VLPLMGKTTLGVSALSYAGQFNIMAVADHDACPDLDAFAAAARDELRALAASTRPRAGSPPAALSIFPAGRAHDAPGAAGISPSCPDSRRDGAEG